MSSMATTDASAKSEWPRCFSRLRSIKSRVIFIYAVLLAVNAGGWIWALTAFHRFPLLLGTAFLAYTFGLRHAVDADHIAAIDNVTRKLMQQGQRPTAVGFFFSLGHSTIVVALSVVIALTSSAIKSRVQSYQDFGGIVDTAISAFFLLGIGLANILVLLSVYRTFQHVKGGGRFVDEDLNLLLARRALLGRIFRKLFRLIGHSWQMYLIGLLFGLGFDTATEIGLLGISASEASKGLPIWSILVFPTLFTAGMALVDSTDGILMLGAYGWAFVKPMRKLVYNLTITVVSVLVALLVGGIEIFGLIGDRFKIHGAFWNFIGALNDNFGLVGFGIIGLFVVSWAISILIYKIKRYDELPIDCSSGQQNSEG
jgi:nickel/cobalt transporter (NiCoT) family protein